MNTYFYKNKRTNPSDTKSSRTAQYNGNPITRRGLLTIVTMVLITISCGDNSTSPNDPNSGSLRVTVETAGGDSNPAGYTFMLQGVGSFETDANEVFTYSNIPEGSYSVELTEMASHCAVTSQNPRTVQIIAGTIIDISFEVECKAILRNQIVFLSDRDSGVGIYKMNPDGSGVARVAEFNVSSIWRPAISPDGTKIAFVSSGGGFTTQQVWVVDADGTNWANLTNDNSRHNEHPTWSPDGSQIAFHAWPPNGEGDIYIMNADGSGKTNITNSTQGDWWPSWSPDGQTIAFHTTESGVPPYISTIKTDGSGRTELFRDNTVFYRNPSWSPDGNSIAFQSNLESGVSWEIMIADANGSNPRSVTNFAESGISHRFPTWSPDGSKLAFDSNRAGNNVYDIFVVNSNGSGLTNITNNNGTTDIFPSWSIVE